MYLFIVFFYPHHYKTFATATSNTTIGGHLGKGKNVQVGIKAVYLTLRLFYFPRHWGAPRNVRTVEHEGAVLNVFEEDGTRSIRTVSREMGLSKSSVQRVPADNTGLQNKTF
jgi:hypothetical protein